MKANRIVRVWSSASLGATLISFLCALVSDARAFEWGKLRKGDNTEIHSIEWTVAQADLIVLARTKSIVEISPDGKKLSTPLDTASTLQLDSMIVVTLDIERVVKGSSVTRVEAAVPGGQTIQRDESGMYFLRKASDSDSATGALPKGIAWIGVPARSYLRLQLNAMLPICDGEGNVIKAAEDAVQRVDSEVLRGLDAQTPTTDIILMSGYHSTRREHFEWLQCVTVPVDDRAVERAIRWAKSSAPLDRFNAACILSAAPDAKAIDILQSLMHDLATEKTPPFLFTKARDNPGRWHFSAYPTRLQAYMGLAKRGASPSWPVLAEAPFPTAYFGFGRIFTWIAAGLLIVCALIIGGFHKSPVSYRRVFFGFSGICVLIVMGVSIMLYRGQFRIEELAVPLSRSSRLELAKLRGSLRVLYFNASLQPPPGYTCTDVSTAMLEAWDPAEIMYPERMPRAARHGTIRGLAASGDGSMWNIDGSIARYGYVAISWWVIAALAALLPALRAWRWWQSVRWQRRGCCRQCGYDLRASPTKCPECGWELGAQATVRRG